MGSVDSQYGLALLSPPTPYIVTGLGTAEHACPHDHDWIAELGQYAALESEMLKGVLTQHSTRPCARRLRRRTRGSSRRRGARM